MLPDLVSLLPAWDWKNVLIDFDPLNWQQVLQNDPQRWYVLFSVSPGTSFYLWTVAGDTVIPVGIYVDVSRFTMKYKDWGPLLGSEWWVYGRGSTDKLAMVDVAIRKPNLLSDMMG